MHQAAQLRLRGAARLLLLDAQATYHGGREAQVNGQGLSHFSFFNVTPDRNEDDDMNRHRG